MNIIDKQAELLVEGIEKHSRRRFFEIAFERFFRIGKAQNISETTCDVDCGNITITGVKLSVLGNDDALIVKPKNDSLVLIQDISGGNQMSYMLVKSFKIDKITLNVDKEIVINGKKIVINDGENDGLVKIRKLEQNLDNIKSYLNTLNTAIATGLSGTVGDAGATAASTFEIKMLSTILNFENMENEKIKH
jgi:hypothetical protein